MYVVFRDMSKLRTDFKVNPVGVVDLSQMLNEIKKINEKWSLNGMLVHVVSRVIVVKMSPKFLLLTRICLKDFLSIR